MINPITLFGKQSFHRTYRYVFSFWTSEKFCKLQDRANDILFFETLPIFRILFLVTAVSQMTAVISFLQLILAFVKKR